MKIWKHQKCEETPDVDFFSLQHLVCHISALALAAVMLIEATWFEWLSSSSPSGLPWWVPSLHCSPVCPLRFPEFHSLVNCTCTFAENPTVINVTSGMMTDPLTHDVTAAPSRKWKINQLLKPQDEAEHDGNVLTNEIRGFMLCLVSSTWHLCVCIYSFTDPTQNAGSKKHAKTQNLFILLDRISSKNTLFSNFSKQILTSTSWFTSNMPELAGVM